MFPLLQSTRFYDITRVSSLQLDWGLITALVERWRFETHTFQMPMGECTITLQDVGVLLGLPVDGILLLQSVRCLDLILLHLFLDIRLRVIGLMEVDCSWAGSWILFHLEENASEEELRHYTRFYLLQLIAGCLFTDHSGGLIEINEGKGKTYLWWIEFCILGQWIEFK